MMMQLVVSFIALGATDKGLMQEVVCAETAFSRAAEAKDQAAFLSFVDADARFVTGRVARGKAGVAEAWSAVFEPDGPNMRWRPAIVEVSADGMLAISRGPYRSRRSGDGGELIETWGYYISTWRRDAEGHWKVLFDTGGDAGMEPTESDIAILEGEPDCGPD